ncbi:MAG: redox-regulated ATPase YchF, partial [Candidatus Dependentiae bacterium]|nr:redox-regulated ATPase YchF [Candidatus Dependentiae bacterium]
YKVEKSLILTHTKCRYKNFIKHIIQDIYLMTIQAGLVGLPNVGKSSLFNALTKSSVPAENYPFCTIDPHMAITHVPDRRLDEMQRIYGSKKQIPATVNFVDIAGLVKGAASGQGLGNQFLSHIREVDLILHVLRCFEDTNILHSGETIDPLADYEIIISELMLKDLESVEKRLQRMEKLIKTANKPAEKKELEAEEVALKLLVPALNAADLKAVQQITKNAPRNMVPLLSAKNFLIIANVAESELENDDYKNNKHYQALVGTFGIDRIIPVCAKVEYELSQLSNEEAQEMMNLIGIKERSLDRIIQQTYKHLGLITFFTCGPQEAHAWPIKQGITIRQAAGEIHSDLERGFICADIFNCEDLIKAGSETKLKEIGKLRTEGQDYIVQDGDVVHIKFNV